VANQSPHSYTNQHVDRNTDGDAITDNDATATLQNQNEKGYTSNERNAMNL
jgi:hypothetical protein